MKCPCLGHHNPDTFGALSEEEGAVRPEMSGDPGVNRVLEGMSEP